MFTIVRRSHSPWARRFVVLVLAALLVAVPLQTFAAKGGKKGGGDKGGDSGGGGGGDSGGAVPEMHLTWQVELLGSYSAVRPVVGPDVTIYAVDVSDNLYAVTPAGDIKWSKTNAGSKGVDVDSAGNVYTGNENAIRSYRPDGNLRWEFIQDPRAFVLIDVAVGPDDNVYAVASSGMGIFSLNNGDGSERWRTREIYARPFTGYTEIEFDANQLYFHANNHTRSVTLDKGTEVFTVGDGNTPPRVNAVTGYWHRPAAAYYPDAQNAWTFDFPLATGTYEPTLGNSGTHYAVNSGDTLYAIDAWGSKLWDAPLDEFVGLPDVDPSETVILMDTSGSAAFPGAIKAVSARNGSPLWRMEFPARRRGA